MEDQKKKKKKKLGMFGPIPAKPVIQSQRGVLDRRLEGNRNTSQFSVRPSTALMQAVLPNLYISAWYTIAASGVLEKDGITHVMSIMTDIADSERLKPFKRMIVAVNDDPDEDLIDHFAAANQWIDDAVADGGKVLVHW